MRSCSILPLSCEDTLVRFGYLPVIRAQLALNQKDRAKAVELLQSAAHNEFGWQGAGTAGISGSHYPIHMRGQAYLAANRGAEAAAEFSKTLLSYRRGF